MDSITHSLLLMGVGGAVLAVALLAAVTAIGLIGLATWGLVILMGRWPRLGRWIERGGLRIILYTLALLAFLRFVGDEVVSFYPGLVSRVGALLFGGFAHG